MALAGATVGSGALLTPGGAQGPQGATGSSGGVDPGTWATLTPASGWSAGPVTPQYRLQTIGAVQTVFCRGTIQCAYSALGTTAFTFPTSALFPSAARSLLLGGYQNTGTASDVSSLIATVSTAGVVTIYFLGGSAFVYADKTQTQVVYLDGLIFSI